MEDITRAEAFVRAVSPWLVHIVEACSVLVIVYGVVRAVNASILGLVRDPSKLPTTRIRLDLGQSLSLALEFLLAADILETMISPTLEQVGILGAVAVIRTFLNYFLGREIAEENRELRAEAATRAAAASAVAAPSAAAGGMSAVPEGRVLPLAPAFRGLDAMARYGSAIRSSERVLAWRRRPHRAAILRGADLQAPAPGLRDRRRAPDLYRGHGAHCGRQCDPRAVHPPGGLPCSTSPTSRRRECSVPTSPPSIPRWRMPPT